MRRKWAIVAVVIILFLAMGLVIYQIKAGSGHLGGFHGISTVAPSLSTTTRAATTQRAELVVGVVPGFAPFSEKTTRAPGFKGVVVDLFQHVAAMSHISYHFVEAPSNVDDAIDNLSKGQFDILIGPISVTYDRMEKITYTHPYFLNKIGLVIPTHRITFWSVLSGALGFSAGLVFLIMGLGLILFSHLFWYFERGTSRVCKKSYSIGIGYGFWVIISTFLQQVLYDPRKLGSRVVMSIWLVMSMLFMVAASALITASLTVSMTLGERDYSSESALYEKPIAVVKGTVEVDMVKRLGAHPVFVNNVDEGIDLVDKRKVDAFMNDYYIMQYHLLKMNTPNARMSQLIISNDVYAFALPKASQLERPLSLAITHLQDNGVSGVLCQKYIVNSSKSCQF